MFVCKMQSNEQWIYGKDNKKNQQNPTYMWTINLWQYLAAVECQCIWFSMHNSCKYRIEIRYDIKFVTAWFFSSLYFSFYLCFVLFLHIFNASECIALGVSTITKFELLSSNAALPYQTSFGKMVSDLSVELWLCVPCIFCLFDRMEKSIEPAYKWLGRFLHFMRNLDHRLWLQRLKCE